MNIILGLLYQTDILISEHP